mmetsp:Transcript_15498/g.25818  ORF Transcript_15498/g.25818 Transcript_15498/m.25818 type:complete len:1284 (-) Transcript_15498:206-4057(-)
MLKQQVTKKKKKGKASKEKRSSQKARVLARPNQPLGTSFEYDHSVRAMRVTDFVSPDSIVFKSGVKPGMHLTEVDDLSVVGLKQDDVVFMLQRKADSLRELLFETLHVTQQTSVPKADSRFALRTQSASTSQSPTVITDKSDDASLSTAQHLPQLTSPTTSSSPIRNTARMLPSAAPPRTSNSATSSTASTSSDLSPRHHKSQELQKAISSASQTSYLQMMKQGVPQATPTPSSAASSSYRPGGPRGHVFPPSTTASATSHRPSASSSTSHDPFSTPARRRRLVADVARFLLKQYCTQACSLVHMSRLRNRSATVIQCMLRSYLARRLFRCMLFKKHSDAATRMQALMRMVLAKDVLRRLQARRRLQLATHLAVCLQCLSRVRRSHIVVAKVREEKTRVAVGVQRLFRGRCGRRRSQQRRRQLEMMRNAKQQAAIRVQSQIRRRKAERVLLQLRMIYEMEMCMSSRIAFHWRRRCRRRRLAVIEIQRVERGRRGRRAAAMAARKREEEQMRVENERLMAIEDRRASLLRAQHRVEVRVDLSPSLLGSLKRCKIATLIKWCVEQSVLKYEEEDRGSYAMGEVIKQVLRATRGPAKPPTEGRSLHAKHAALAKENSIDIKQSGDEKQAILLPTSSEGFPSRFDKRYTGKPTLSADNGREGITSSESTRIGRPLTLRITPAEEGGCVHMHLEPVFRSFAAESERLRVRQLRKGKGASMDDPLLCPNLSSCDIHIILGVDTDQEVSSASTSLGGKYVGAGGAQSLSAVSDEEEMLKFRFKDVSVSVSVTTIVDGDDTTECLVNAKRKREEEERVRAEAERIKAKELADLEATKALVAEINAMAEAQQREEAERAAKLKADEEAAAAAAAAAAAKLKAANAGKRSRPTTATKKIKVSVIDEDAREKELLRKRLEEEEAERRRRLEEERLAAEKLRLARLQAIRENSAASCIQRHYRAHLKYKRQSGAARIIQACAKRRRLLMRWWNAVNEVLRRMHVAVSAIQNRYRGHKARDLVLALRLEACSNQSLQEADHWMNVQVLDDFRFALGRSFISEGKKGYVIGGRNSDKCEESVVEGDMEEGEESVLQDDEEDSEDDESGESDDESEEEEDYVINQRLNKNKITKADISDMDDFVNRLFAADRSNAETDNVTTEQGSPSVVCYGSLEEMVAHGAPVSLQASGKWAGQLMHLLEFLPPPPRCVKPLEVLIHLPPPPKASHAKQSIPHGSKSGSVSGDVAENNLGDLCLLSDRHILPFVENADFKQISKPPERVPAIYSMGGGAPSLDSAS